MHLITILALLITLLGSGLALLKLPEGSLRLKAPTAGFRSGGFGDVTRGMRILTGFTVIVFAFGLLTLKRFWPEIERNEKNLYFAAWLFLTMVAGMFVQVLASNYREGNPLFVIEAGRLVFPLLFCLVVFYPIWSLAAGAPTNLFVFHAAFLNGYFWESVVSAARAPMAREVPETIR